MTRQNLLAAELYRMAVRMKNQNSNQWKRTRERNDCISSLSAMHFLTHCIGMKHMSFQQAETIVSVLRNTYHFDDSELLDSMRDAAAQSDYTIQYEELLFQMHHILSVCIDCAIQKKKDYINSLNLYIKGFHNMPRAFLSTTDKSIISPQDALGYSNSYLKNN